MSEGKVDRRTFTQGATVALGALLLPSLPAWAARSVRTNWPAGENVKTSSFPTLTTTMLP